VALQTFPVKYKGRKLDPQAAGIGVAVDFAVGFDYLSARVGVSPC